MNKYIINAIFVFILLNSANLLAQNSKDLFITKEFKTALTKQTRTLNGEPGVNYWQNRSDYKIQAQLDPQTRILSGSEEINYSNNSNDTLKILAFNLYQDLFKKGVARDWDIGAIDLTDGVKIKSLNIDGKEINLNRIKHNSTKMIVSLDDFFTPKSKHTIKVEWSFIFPGTLTIRMGTYDSTNFMVAYWYPKIAVYDDVMGWALRPHTGNCEFYHEFGNYDVELTAPENYLMWSTGVLQNSDELFTKKYLDRIEAASKSDDVIHIVTKEDRENGDILKNKGANIWKFKSTNSPDFAFAMSDKYIWDATSVNTGSRRVSINAVYKTDSKDFHLVANLARKSIEFYSFDIPKFEYPYPQLTLFNGDGGMEFPGMVNDGDFDNYNATLYVTAHEIGHSYFPFNTGLNEQSSAWMDEGMITFLPRFFVKANTKDSSYVAFKDIVALYNKRAGSSMEIPLMIPSTNTGFAYRYHAYNRPSVAFLTLYNYLGKEKFTAALKEFATIWEQKHPYPYDFFFTFNKVAGEDLSWFWKPWFYEMAYADLAIGKIENKKVQILNKGGLPVNVNIEFVFDDGSKKVSRKANIWKNGVKEIWVNMPRGNVRKIILDTETTPDAFPNDNYTSIRELE